MHLFRVTVLYGMGARCNASMPSHCAVWDGCKVQCVYAESLCCMGWVQGAMHLCQVTVL